MIDLGNAVLRRHAYRLGGVPTSPIYVSLANPTKFDPNALEKSFTHNNLDVTVEVFGGIGGNDLQNSLAYLVPALDINLQRLNADHILGYVNMLEVITPPANGTDLWVALGMGDNADLTLGTQFACGLHWDIAPGPESRGLRHQVTTADGTPSATHVHSIGISCKTIRGESAFAYPMTAAWAVDSVNIAIVTSGGTLWNTGNDLFHILAFGRSTAVAGDVTVTVRPWIIPIIAQPGDMSPYV